MTSIAELDECARRVTAAVEDLIALAGPACTHLQRRSLDGEIDRVRSAVEEAATGQLRVAIVGEFKSGKSALVNALVGQAIVGSDPIRTTSVVTEVRHGSEAAYHAEINGDDGNMFLTIDRRACLDLSLDPEPSVDGRPVDALRVAVGAPLLGAGLRLVDTPSVSGGLSSPMASVVLGELLQSQAWILATDASQELTAPECELLTVGATLCPVVIVVATKTDVAPHAQRVIEKNLEILERLELPTRPVLVPTAVNLFAASNRTGDESLERESGVPLLRWYISRVTTSAARLEVARRTAEDIASAMETVESIVENEIGVLTNTGERASILDRSERARRRCEELLTAIRPAVQRTLNEFRRQTRRDLEDRIETVRRNALDDLEELDHVREWASLDRRVQADVNRVLAEHLVEIRSALERAIEIMVENLGLSSDDVRIIDRVHIGDHEGRQLSGQLARPEARGGPTRAQQMLVPARVGVVGAGGVGIVASAQIVALTVVSAAMLPVAVAGSAWWVRRRYKEAESATWKQEARAELSRFITESHQLIGRCSEDVRDEILADLPNVIEDDLRRIAEELAAEFERLQRLAADRANVHRDELAELEAWQSELRVVATHARRAVHRLHVPQILDLTEARMASGERAELSDATT